MKAKDLRNSILQQAVQGELVPQDPTDEPASVLLDRIREERKALVKEGKAKAPKGGESVIYRGADGSYYERRGKAKPICIDDEIPFEIPESWEWTRMFTICVGIVDCPHSTPGYLTETTGYFAIDTNCIDDGWHQTQLRPLSKESYQERIVRLRPEPGDVVFTREGSIGRSAILQGENICLGQRVMLLRCSQSFHNRFLQIVLSSPSSWNLYRAANVGTGVKHINVSTIVNMLTPLPPLAEQSRISARVDKLTPLVEQFGALEDEREALDSALPDQMKKSILQQAVQGELAPQDPADGPASVLLDRIREERKALVKEGKAKAPKGGESVIYRGADGSYYERRGKAEPTCIDDEIPFEIPEGWEWARLATLGVLERGSGIKRSQVTKDGLPCVRYGELYTTYSLEIAECNTKIPASLFSSSHTVACGEILMTLTGENDIDIGRAVVNNSGSEIAFGGDLLALKHHMQNGKYLAYCINSAYVGTQRTALATGNIIVHLSAGKIGSFLVAIPPQNEQARIVARLDELTPLIENCNAIEDEHKNKDAADLFN
ncbi:MAG: restriction endonuclease subunit S [Atopobiaceae bacterium]|jgi:type I restriction enzyme S subunit|nr:restriction endonuclease subunit S [Atopobiaceae bacterium]MCI2172616.1 restriction endonuclease subunit S [Atopobiaceae bacterium]MCI2206923.1 restriction endonuclease subunit S [Atopobiaceae bacterium]